ncbi:MAG TPA: tetratricopeptide repeat protein [Anaerolineales bacterium]|nr:tetratricopeptide repeat protein [Anaerolineales bacterium]
MLSLPRDLDQQCFSVFVRCTEFDNAEKLRAVFTTNDLDPFRDDLPAFSGSKRQFVSQVKLFLLEKQLADGRELILPFLDSLSSLYEEQDSLHGDLNRLHQRMLAQHSLNRHYICYMPGEGDQFAERLHNALQQADARPWLEKRNAPNSWDPEAVRDDALRGCASVLFILTPANASVQPHSTAEWQRALHFKKPIIPLRFVSGVDLPRMLGQRAVLDFTGSFEYALGDLLGYLDELNTPVGQLRELEYRLADAERELHEAGDNPRILQDIQQLKTQIEAQRAVAHDPRAAAQAAEERTREALEVERERDRRVTEHTQIKFINPPPEQAAYFLDRVVETKRVGNFLRNGAQRLLTVVGRAGIGKTAMICRLLKSLEDGYLPNDEGPLSVDGIVYLRSSDSYRLRVFDLYTDLTRLLPDATAQQLNALYRDPRVSNRVKMQTLLAAFPTGLTILLLDNFEELVDTQTFKINDADMEEALRTFLEAPHHTVKVILTTHFAPGSLALVQPGRQMRLDLEEGLPSPDAENLLRAMDVDGTVHLRDAPNELLSKARERTHGYPRALEHLYAILSADRNTELVDILDDTAKLLPDEVMQVLVGEAVSRLDDNATRVMQALAIYQRPVTPTAVDYLLQPYQLGVNSAPELGRLVNMKLVRRDQKHYYFDRMTQAYVIDRLPRGNIVDRDKTDAPPYTQYALLRRGAEFFNKLRTKPDSWKTIKDLDPQRAEFDLYCAGEMYDAAAALLIEIDENYLYPWGYYRLGIDMHERLQGRLNSPTLEMESSSRLGKANQSTGQYEKAAESFERAVSFARQSGDRLTEGRYLGSLGICYSRLGQNERAKQCFEQALDIAREQQDRAGESLQLGSLGQLYSRLGQIDDAIELLQQALAISREVQDRSAESSHLGSLGLLYNSQEKTDQAIEFLEQAVAITRSIPNRFGEGRNLGSLGLCYFRLGQTERAIENLQKALAIAREIQDSRGEEQQLGSLGLCYGDVGQTLQAEEYLSRALHLARKLEDSNGEGWHLCALAGILLDNGRYEEAIHCGREAIQVGDRIGNTALASFGNRFLATAYLYLEEIREAREAVEAAIQHAEPANRLVLQLLSGVIALRQGDAGTAAQAFEQTATQAQEMIMNGAKNPSILDTKGLALCGLVICGVGQHKEEAVEAFRMARQGNRSAGVIQRVLSLFDAMTLKDPRAAKILVEVREAASAPSVS